MFRLALDSTEFTQNLKLEHKSKTIHTQVMHQKDGCSTLFFFSSDCVVTAPAAKGTNDADAKKLWDMSVELVKLGDYDPFTANDPGVKTV